jgi:N-carbamoylputrescine amidase
MPKEVRVGLVQMRCRSQPESNLERTLTLIREAAESGCQVICLQELFRSLYFCQQEDEKRFDLAETIPGPTTKVLVSLANELKLVIIASIFEKRTAGIYHNTAVILDQNGSLAGKYRKMHIPDDPHYYEKFYFTPGDLGFRSHSTSRGRFGVLVCWDQWFPEAARLTTLAGAQILFYPTAIGWGPDQSEKTNLDQHSAWETIQRSHAVANGVFVAAVNRVGQEDNLQFWGQSFICDPFGRVIAKASAVDDEVLIADLDLASVERIRREWCFLRDRRVDAYGGLTSLYLD